MGKRGVGWIGRSGLTYTLHVQNSQPAGTCSTAQAAQLGALWWPRRVGWGREGSPRGRECMCTYDKPRQYIKNQRHHLADKGLYNQSYGLCESWTRRKAECWRIDAFELWYWRRFLRTPWTSRRSNQSILKEISTEYSFVGLLLKLQYFGYLMWRAKSLEKTLMLGKTEGKRGSGGGWDG